MEKLQVSTITPVSQKLIEITPADLRLIADKIEAQEKTTEKNQAILFPFTKNITFVYYPQIRNLSSKVEL